MVHRKSTYKLMFKNINNDIRKTIWLENSHIREVRRHVEMSHHPIDDENLKCECQCNESDGDSNEEDNIEETNVQPKEISTVIYDEPVKKITFNNSQGLDKQNKKKLLLRSEEFIPNIKKNKCKSLENICKRTEEDQKGVMKFNSATGEYDLIPAIGINWPKTFRTKTCESTKPLTKSVTSKYSSPYIKSAERRIAVESHKFSPTSTNMVKARSNDALFTTPDIFNKGRTLVSMRKYPRMRGKQSIYSIGCPHCGKSLNKKELSL